MNQTILLSPRLQLRPIVQTDWEAVHSLNSMPEINRYNPSGIPENTAQSQFAVAGWVTENEKTVTERYTFALELRDGLRWIGLIAINLGKGKYLNAEVWYKLDSNDWGQGYATEALQRILDFGFGDLGLHRIEAGCAVDNVGSLRVLEKVGMQREARRRALLPLQGGWSDNFEYAILDTDARTASGR
jgi:[ribosomal protein S5]-alanine N-acetyltransferase